MPISRNQKAECRFSSRVLLVNILCMLCIVPMIYVMEPVFLAIGVEKEPAKTAAGFMQLSALGVPVRFF